MSACAKIGVVVLLLAGAACRGPAADSTCGTCTAAPGAFCEDGTCKPRLPERPPPHIEDREHDVASVPYEYVAAWPVGNGVAGQFVGSLLTGAGIPHRETGTGEWQDLSVPEVLAPKARRLLDLSIQGSQPGRSPTAGIPTDAPPHLAFKVLARR